MVLFCLKALLQLCIWEHFTSTLKLQYVFIPNCYNRAAQWTVVLDPGKETNRGSKNFMDFLMASAH